MGNDHSKEGDRTFAVGETSAVDTAGFAERLRIALSGRTVQWLADNAGISYSTVRKYLDGSSPTVDKAASLARALGCSLDWLATGQDGQLAPSVSAAAPGFSEAQASYAAGPDPELLGRIVDVVDRVHREEQVRLQKIDLGRISAEKYSEISSAAADRDEWPALLELLAVRLRRALRAAATDPTSVKREA